MSEKIHIALCMGSSCFARGNNAMLAMLEALIRDNNWQDRISLSGMRCENQCNQGPNILIDGQRHQGLDAGAMLDLLEEKLSRDAAASPSFATRKLGARKDG